MRVSEAKGCKPSPTEGSVYFYAVTFIKFESSLINNMKIYLTSFAARAIDKIDFSGLETVAFVTTAADPYENKSFIEEDRQALENKGLKLTDVDLKKFKSETIKSFFQDFDILFVCGGNSFYLLEKIKECGLDKELRSLLDDGLLYIGSSAGSIVCCPNIEYAAEADDPSKAKLLKDFSGFNLVDFSILPHYGREKYAAMFEKIIHDFSHLDFQLIKDDEIILVEDNHYTKL